MVEPITYKAIDEVDINCSRIEAYHNFIQSTEKKVLLLNEPVGTGKTSFLIDECLELTNRHRNTRIVFLTYSNAKARELEEDLRNEASARNFQISIVRLFGHKEIPKEFKEGQIESCVNQEKVERAQSTGNSVSKVCFSCVQKTLCPYFLRKKEAVKLEPQITIGNHGHISNEGFFLGGLFPTPDLLILDEDGHTKSVIHKRFPKKLSGLFVYALKSLFSKSELDMLECDPNDEFASEIFRKYQQTFRLLSQFSSRVGWGRTNDVEKSKFHARGLYDVDLNIERSVCYFDSLPKEQQTKTLRDFEDVFRFSVNQESQLNILVDGDYLIVSILPDLFEISKKFDLNTRIIIADATATKEEVQARYGLLRDELVVSYDPIKTGILRPRGEIFQIADNVSESSCFTETGKGKSKKSKLNKTPTKNALKEVFKRAKRLNFQSKETWVIPFMRLSNESYFHGLVEEAGFHSRPDIYHGNLRGLNFLKDKNIILLGSTFPPDETLKISLLKDIGRSIEYSYSDHYLVWNGNTLLTTPLAPHTRASGWIKKMNARYGEYGRKKYIEGLIQSLRSRFYFHETKTLLVCPYPLIDFGIAVHGLDFSPLTNSNFSSQGEIRKLLKALELRKSLTQKMVEKITSQKLGATGLRGYAQKLNRHTVKEGQDRLFSIKNGELTLNHKKQKPIKRNQ